MATKKKVNALRACCGRFKNEEHNPECAHRKVIAQKKLKLAMPKIVGGGLPMPLMWSDLCDCGKTRLEHVGRNGMGRCGECPSFREAR